MEAFDPVLDVRAFAREHVPAVLGDRPFRLAVVGGRKYPRLDLPAALVESMSAGVEVVSGGAEGVDKAAEDAAEARADLPDPTSYPVLDWRREDGSFDAGAGMRRNGVVVGYADGVCAFWDRVSTGTANTIRRAIRANKLLAVWDETGRRMSLDEVLATLVAVERARRARSSSGIRIRGLGA